MDKKVIPIAFCFDQNLELPAGVCITSLLTNAKPDTFYDIFILHSDKSSFEDSKINELSFVYGNCNISYRCVGKTFERAFEIKGEIRNITVATYYRFLIPILIPEYDKVIYSDVDVVFREDLSEIYQNTTLEGYYVAGVVSASFFDPNVLEYISKLGLDWHSYIYAGNLIMNSKLLREEFIVDQLIEEANNSSYIYQDMDIINLICKDKIKRLPPVFCFTIEMNQTFIYELEQNLYTKEELVEAAKKGIIHYNGAKPWKQYCPNFDFWWEYYRNSIFFDAKFYYDFFYAKLNDYDSLPLCKRVKILIRYFKNGRWHLPQ